MSSPWLMSRIYKLTDVTGLTAWRDYIPILTVADPSRANSTDAGGSKAVSQITDITGLIAWRDYVPVYETTGAEFRFDNDGVIPVSYEGSVSGIPVIEAAGSSANMSISASVNGTITQSVDSTNNTFKSETLYDYELGDRPKLYFEVEVTYGGGSVLSVGFPWSLATGTSDLATSDAGIYLRNIGVVPNITDNISAGETGSATGWTAVTSGDIVGVAADYENLKIYTHKNGTWGTGGEPGVGAGITMTNTIPNSGREGITFGCQLSRIANSLTLRGSSAQYAPDGYEVIGAPA